MATRRQPQAHQKKSKLTKRRPRLPITAGDMPGPTLVGMVKHYVQAVTYKAPKCDYAIHAGAACVPRHLVDAEYEQTLLACMQCDVMYRNFSCPPHAPSFNKLRPTADRLVIGWARIFPPEMRKANPKLSTFYLMVAADRLMYHLVHRVGRAYRDAFGGYLLGAASCRKCKPCAAAQGAGKCAHPEERVYSLEATGVRCDKLMARLGWPMTWYVPGTGKLEPIMHMCGILGGWPGKDDGVLARAMMRIILDDSKVEGQFIVDKKEAT